MNGRIAFALALALVFGGIQAPAQQSLRVFGLEFTVVSNAVMALGDADPAVKVIQVGGPDCGIEGGTNDLEDFEFGVTVHLGEAQSGVYVYPDAECREDYRSMWGNAYGNVNGETNRLISSVKGTRIGWGDYRVEVDLTPLGATSYTYHVWSDGIKTMHATNQGATAHISTYTIEDRDPRVNPFFLTESGPAVIIEFPNGTYFSLEENITAVGDRMMIVAEGATNQVNYVSRVDVFGSANLPAFAINDTRIGMFGRPHKALGTVNFTASNGRLTAGPFEPASGTNAQNGVLVDFKQLAVRWEVQTEPFALGHSNAELLLSASGFMASLDSHYSAFWGPVGFTRSNGMLHAHADLLGIFGSNVVLQVFRSNILSGAIYGTSGTRLGTLAETNPLVTGWMVTTQAVAISIAEPTRITGHDGTILEGDRFEFEAHDSSFRVQYISSAPVLAQGIASVTITSEVMEDFRPPEPRLQIERLPTALRVSWPYLSGLSAVTRTNLIRDPYAYLYPEYRDLRSYVLLSPTNTMEFISLRHYYWFYIKP